MASSFLNDLSSPVHSEDHTCENCQYWLGDWQNKIFARIAGEHVWVGQCMGCEEDDKAPMSGLDNGAEAFVFTPCNGFCRAFSVHHDIEAGDEEMRATYASLDRDMMRDAWEGV